MKIFLVVVTLFLCITAQATTYYISPSGNDATGTGTITNPWKTLYKACNTVSVSGDIIHVSAGTYLETVQAVLKPGVSIEGDGVTSILKSTLTADFTAMLSLLSATEGTNGNQHISNLKFDGQNLSTFWCIYVGGRSNVSIHDVTFVDFKETGVIFSGRVDNAELAPTTYATGNSFYNNTMLNCSLYYTYGRGNFDFAGQDGMLIYNNTITQNQRPAGSNGYCVKFTNNGFNKGCKIYGNNFTRAQGTGGDYDFCVEMGNTSGLEVYNNIFNGGALDMNFQTKGAYAYSVWIHDNQFLQPAFNPLANQNGVILEYGTEGVIIENNVFSKQNYGISFTPRDGSVIKNIIIRKNLMTGICGGVWNGYYVTFGGVGNSFTVDSVDIYNNTMEYDRSQRFSLGISLPQATAGTFSNINIINNIIAGGTAAAVGQAGTTSISNLHIQYNDFYNNGNNNNAYFVGPALGAGYAFTNNINNVPTYAANNTLPSGSPLIDAGTYVGLAYSGNKPDIGYFEFGSTSSNIPPTVNAGTDQSITLPINLVTLSGTATDSDGAIASYQWTKVSGSTAIIVTPALATTLATTLGQGVYKFELKVTDNSGATARDTVQITVNPAANVPPTASAGADQTITLPTNSVNLSGSGTDTDGTIASYSWVKITGPAATITTPGTGATAVTGLVQGTYQFQLTVTDNSGATAKDTVQITVNPAANVPPTASAGADQTITLPTNSVNLSGSGTDTDGTISTYAWTKISGPAATITTPGAGATSVTGLVQGTYKFQLTVTDNNGATGKDTVQITVNSATNIPPTANAGNDITITLPTNSVNLSGSGTDTDGTIASYSWAKISGPAATITTPGVAATSVTGLVQGTYQFQLTVTDNSGATATDIVQVTVNPAPNVPPTANAGNDITITLPTNAVTLTGSGTDVDGTITAYSWTKVSGPAATITTPAGSTTSVTGLAQGTYQFQLTVTDNSGATATDIVQVTVNPAPNVPPTANAGNDITITLPTNAVTLTGSGTDVDGTITTYSWTKISGPSATITTPAGSTTSVTGLVQGTYQFQLTVTDNSGATATDIVQVTVNPAPNVPPTANAGNDITITLPTNSVNLSGSGTDTDGTIASYSWAKISGPAATITTPGVAATSVTGLVQGTYQFQLTVTDNSGATATDIVQVTVNPAPNVPPTANAGNDITITLPTNAVTLTGSGTDVDGTITAYSWTKVSGPAATITTPAGSTTSVTGLAQGTYQFQLTVTDNSGATATDIVQVTVNPAPNVPPTANAGNDITITLPTNAVTLTGSGTDVDGTITTYSWTKISGPSATITTPAGSTTSVTGLVQGIYQFQLTVTDNSGATATAVVKVTVNRPPNVLPTANAGADVYITLPVTTANLAGSGADIDGTIAGYSWAKISGPNAGIITNPTAAATTVTGLIAGVYKYELTVTDNDGGTATATMQVIVFAPNIAPTADAGLSQSITLPTNSVTVTGRGSDVDGTIVSYRWTKISGPAAGVIVSPASPGTLLTGLTQGIYQFQLTVTDNNGATATDAVQVTVNPENIPPFSNAGPDQTITLPINTATLVGSGTDIDGTVVSYRWKLISGPADKLTTPTSATSVLVDLIEGAYQFELTVTDNKGATDKDTMTLNVISLVAPVISDINVYPNPVVDYTTLNINTTTLNATVLIFVTDLQGKTVYKKQVAIAGYNAKERLDMKNFSKGSYIVTVYFDAANKQSIQAVKTQ